jgi:alginate O-acetyltransferase complex protein AlgI
MIFNEVTYFLCFLLPAVLLFHRTSARVRPWVLAFSGVSFFIFYGTIHFGGFWGGLCVLIFIWELLVSRLYRPGSVICIFGIIQAVGILVFFKYSRFLASAWNDAFPGFSVAVPEPLAAVILPLGLSFFTFEFIHFAADSYKGTIGDAPAGHYAAFIFFFPSLVAGPLKRYQPFDAELRGARFDPALFNRGVTRILGGLTKKHVFADTFGLFSDRLLTDAVYAAPPYVLAGWVLAYGMKIYFDFSGYSDVAIGSGYLFGIELPENFNWPYIARNIGDFWRRWHISLSQWIRDYVYVPLGGSRKPGFESINLLAAFAISGLWHGAAYNFLAWGVWHGLMAVGHRMWTQHAVPRGARIPNAVAIAITFIGVNVGWALFCMDMERAWFVLSRLAGGSS